MKTFVITAFVLASAIPLVGFAHADSSVCPESMSVGCCAGACCSILSCFTPCVQGTLVSACASYDSATGCATGAATLHPQAGTVLVVTPYESETVPGVSVGPFSTSPFTVTVASVTLVNEPYTTPGRAVSDTLCQNDPGQGLGGLLGLA